MKQQQSQSQRVWLAVLSVVFALASGAAAADGHEQENAAQRAILVTGASSGIGRNIAETLASQGHFVYAGARKQADLDSLNALDNVQGIRLDVNKPEEIDAAVETIAAAGRGLYGVVNNAGVAVVGPLVELSEADMQFQMDVNLFGPYRVTKAFAPMLIESQGRVTTIGSISGILSSPFLGAYSMSKHAVESFTDTLAAEMNKFGVAVSVVEPGNYDSKIGESLARRIKRSGVDYTDSRFSNEMQQVIDRLASDRSQFKKPDEVSAAVVDFLFSDSPRRRYMVVPNPREAEITIRQIMREMLQLNQDQPYSLTREQLIAMMDDMLGEAKDD
ncbi:MAG: SDR family NAD(P)-dependent oxidoreductase [Pseudomonadota bacterium]